MDNLVEAPPGDVFAATSFAIIQEDENGRVKVRRGEDWRRSSHNATIRAWHVPTYHTVGDFVWLEGWPPRTPRSTSSGTTSSTPSGTGPSNNPHTTPSSSTQSPLWFHLAMCFGGGTKQGRRRPPAPNQDAPPYRGWSLRGRLQWPQVRRALLQRFPRLQRHNPAGRQHVLQG